MLTQCFTPMSYVLAENDAEQDFQIEENMDQEEEEEIMSISEVEEDANNSTTDIEEEEITETITANTENEETTENASSGVQDSGGEQEIETAEITDAENNEEKTEEIKIDTENEQIIDQTPTTNVSNEDITEVTVETGDNEQNIGNNEQNIEPITWTDNNEQTIEEQITSSVETGDNEEWIIDTIAEEINEIIEKIRYFFKRDWDSRYIKYGKDRNNIWTITLTDPKTSASVTIMDKNLWAEGVGVGKSSYGYYFQWWNNNGVRSVNSSNKTTQKAIYKDSYYNHGYDGQWLFIVWSTDYWENGEHYNSLWWNESKESSRYGACPIGYHIPTVSSWVYGEKSILKIHLQIIWC